MRSSLIWWGEFDDQNGLIKIGSNSLLNRWLNIWTNCIVQYLHITRGYRWRFRCSSARNIYGWCAMMCLGLALRMATNAMQMCQSWSGLSGSLTMPIHCLLHTWRCNIVHALGLPNNCWWIPTKLNDFTISAPSTEGTSKCQKLQVSAKSVWHTQTSWSSPQPAFCSNPSRFVRSSSLCGQFKVGLSMLWIAQGVK